MKSFLLATVGLVALVGIAAPASAADMAVKARPPAPVIAPIYDWTGFYIGANGGWGQSRNCVNFVDAAGFVIADGCRERSGGLVGGQIGYAWNAALLYVKGGAAVTSNRFSILDTLTGIELASASSTRWGGAVGVGFEYGFAPNWSVGLEYDHLFMGNTNNSFSVVNPIVAAAVNNRISQDVDMVTVRFNYRFGGYGAPIAARY